jgi:DNA polymerase elongation subunit (family B)
MEKTMKILMLDIETSPNIAHVWGLFKQNVALNQLMDSSQMMCFAAKWYGNSKIYFRSTHADGQKKMLVELWNLMSEADVIVHFNGKRFDIPTINKEFIIAGMAPPDPYHQIDLYTTVKTRFRFPSNKLDYVSKILGLGEKIKHMGHDLWVQCMAGNNTAWSKMKEYNIHDIVLLEKLYVKLLPWIKNHPNYGLFNETEKSVCPNCGSHHIIKNGFETTLTSKYQRYRCVECKTPIRGRKTIIDPTMKNVMLTQSKT